jgi:photosystem II stability/assembly factor-like uncharacterized protein
MYDDKHGVMKTLYDIIVSHDGFQTWDSVCLPQRLQIISVQMISPYTIYCLAFEYKKQNNRFFRSRDGGKSWEEFPYPEPFPEFIHTFSMKFLDSTFGYTVGGDRQSNDHSRHDKIFKTTNGGESWVNVLDTFLYPPFGLWNLDILDRKNAIFVGQFGKIYWTHDGGNSFIYDSSAVVVYKIPATIYTAILGRHTALIADYLGRMFYSSLITTVEKNAKESLGNYITPNPATDYIEIAIDNHTLQGMLGNTSGTGGTGSAGDIDRTLKDAVKVYDVLGVCVATHPLAPSREGVAIRLDVSGLAAGVYFVRVGNKMYKFVKM